jgi:hypothetical protein
MASFAARGAAGPAVSALTGEAKLTLGGALDERVPTSSNSGGRRSLPCTLRLRLTRDPDRSGVQAGQLCRLGPGMGMLLRI